MKTIFTVIFVLLLSSCHTEIAETPKGPPDDTVWVQPDQLESAQIKVSAAEERSLVRKTSMSGKVAFDDERVSHVFSPVTGRVTRLMAKPGDHVKEGTPLAVIESPEVAQAYSDLDKARADENTFRRDYERQKELYEAHAASQKDFEAAEANYARAKAEVERAEEKAKMFRHGIVNRVTQEYTLTSPLTGTVISRMINPGVEVQGQYGLGGAQELFTVGDIDKVWVMADLYEVEIADVHLQDSAEVTVVAYPGQPFPSHVEWISDTLDPNTRTAKVRFTLDNKQHLLKPEMYAQLVVSGGLGPAVLIPRNSVLHLGDEQVVYIETGKSSDGKVGFRRQRVQVDEFDGPDLIRVTSGVAAADQVVTSGAILLSHAGS